MLDRNEQNHTARYPVKWLLGLALSFLLVHAFYYLLGLQFNRNTLYEVMHFLDPLLLRTRLLESVFFLHIQPPLMNFFTGLILKITPESPWGFQGIFLLLGLLLYECTFLLQLRIGVRKPLAATLSFLFMASPSFMLWEHFLLYTLPCAALLALATLMLFDVLEHDSPVALTIFFIALFLVCGMRSMFHLGYFILAFLLLLVLRPRLRRPIFYTGLLPLLLLFSFYAKNAVIFGEFNTCTFVEKNLWIMTVGNMNGAEKVRSVEEKKLTPYALVNRWASLDAYPPHFKEVPDHFQNIPALSETHKSTGAVNYNHYGNIELCNIYGQDAKYVLRHYPKSYLLACLQSAYRYFKSSSDLPVSPGNKEKIQPLIRFYDHVFYGKLPFSLPENSRLMQLDAEPPCLFILLGLPLLFLYTLFRSIYPSTRYPLTSPQRLVLMFILFNIFMVATLGCALDFLETSRYRFMTDATIVVLSGFFIEACGRRFLKYCAVAKEQ